MADVKNFGLSGVGADVQLGKSGPHLTGKLGHVEARTADGAFLTTVKAANATAVDDVVTLAQLQAVAANAALTANTIANTDGFSIQLGDVATKGDGSWSPGAVALDNTTPVSEAVDRLNEVLAKLVPSAPPNFPNGTLSITNTAGNTPYLAAGGVPDNTAGGTVPSAGQAVTRITATGVSSNTFTNVGPGETGTVQLVVNNAVAGSHALTGTGDNGNYAGLVISGQADFPVSTPGFWKSISVAATLAAVSTGLNRFKLNHTAAAATNEVVFVRDAMTANPTISAGSVAEAAAGTLAYSSGIPHYGTGAQLTVGLSVANLSGETYYGGSDPLVLSGTNGTIGSQTFTYSAQGIATPIARNTTTATAITPVTVNVNGTNVFASGTVSATAKNVNGSGSGTVASTNVLVMNGTQAGKVYELSVPVSGLGSIPTSSNAARVALPAGDNPAGATAAWTSNSALPTHEASVVAGVLKQDTTNYSTGYLPAGPDYSGHDAAQYVTFAFARSAVSKFSLVVSGTYAGCWVKLPGVSDDSSISPNGATANGWWTMYKPYVGAGVPGQAGDTTDGCALGTVMGGASGTYVATFGTQTSTNATGNMILVRFKLTAGQSITALSFTN
jgi:hypothetical protein